MIVVSNLEKVFERRRLLAPSVRFTAVADASFEVARGQTLGIVGESGSGKSTLLRVLMRLMVPTSGTVRVDGVDIGALDAAALRRFRRTVQPVFQNPASSFNPRQTIGAILAAPMEVHGVGDRRARTARVAEMLERVGLSTDHARRYPHQLSGGQKQRVAIARAVILEPTVLLADEPTSALDVSVQAQVLDLFERIKADLGLTSVFVSHNLAVIRQVSDRVAVMRRGRIVETGTVDEIFERPRHEYTRTLLEAVPDHSLALARRAASKEA